MTHVKSVSLLFKEKEMSVRFSSFKGMQVRNIIDLFILRAFHSSSVPNGHPGVHESEAITPCPLLALPLGHPPWTTVASYASLHPLFIRCMLLLSSPPPQTHEPISAHTQKGAVIFFFRFRWSLRATQSGQRMSKDKEAKTVTKRWVHNYSHGSVAVGASMCD